MQLSSMPEINPYEAPQSEETELRQPALNSEEGYPRWLGNALYAQLLLILVTIFSPFGWLSNTLQFLIFLLHEAVASALFIAALRYRFGWLVILELIVIGLPLMMWFTVK